MKIGLLALFVLGAAPVNAHHFQNGYSHSETCTKTIYREEYIAGTIHSQGYVKSWNDTVQVPCSGSTKKHPHTHSSNHQPQYSPSYSTPKTKSCNANRTTGGLVGGGLAAALSDEDAYAWAIPLGAVVGMGVGGSGCY